MSGGRPDLSARGGGAYRLALAGIVLLHVAIRLPFLAPSLLARGWNSDSAVFGLMARGMATAGRFDVYFWDQDYLGPLTAMVAAAAGTLLGAVGLEPVPGPLALRVASILLGALVPLAAAAAIRPVLGRRAALGGAAMLAVGPSLLLRNAAVPMGPEMLLPLSLLLLALAARLLGEPGAPAARGAFAFGVVAGFSWWIHAGVVFALGAAAFVAGRRAGVIPAVDGRRFLARLRFDGPALGGKSVAPLARIALLAMQAAGVALPLLSLLAAVGVGRSPAGGSFLPPLSPSLSGLAVVLLAQLLGDLAMGSPRGEAARPVLAAWRRPAILAVAGALLGSSPALLGRLLGRVDGTYGYHLSLIPPAEVASRIAALPASLAEALVGPGRGGAAALIVLALAATSIVGRRQEWIDFLRGKPEAPAGTTLLLATVALDLLFYLTNRRVDWGGPRYLLPAVPILYAFAADGGRMLARRRVLAGTLAGGAVAAALLGEATATHRRLAAEPDLRPVVDRVAASGCRFVLANYYEAFRLELVDLSGTRYAANHGPRRNLAESRRLAAAGLASCVLQDDGTLRPASAADLARIDRPGDRPPRPPGGRSGPPKPPGAAGPP